MSDTDCDKLITIRDFTHQYNNMYVYEGPFGRINPSIRYGSSHPNPVTNPGNINVQCTFVTFPTLGSGKILANG